MLILVTRCVKKLTKYDEFAFLTRFCIEWMILPFENIHMFLVIRAVFKLKLSLLRKANSLSVSRTE